MQQQIFTAFLILALCYLLPNLSFAHYTIESTDYVCACEDWHFDECSNGWAFGWPGRSFEFQPTAGGDGTDGVDGTMMIQYNQYQLADQAESLNLWTSGMLNNKYKKQPAHKRPGSSTILRTTLNGHYYYGPNPLYIYWSGMVQPIGTDINDTSSWPLKTVSDVFNKAKVYMNSSYVNSMNNITFENTHAHHLLTVPKQSGVYQFVMTWNQTLYGNSQLQKLQQGIKTDVTYFNVFHIIVEDSAPPSVKPCYQTCPTGKLPCGTKPGACYTEESQTCINDIIINKNLAPSGLGDVKLCYGWDGSVRAYDQNKISCESNGRTIYKSAKK